MTVKEFADMTTKLQLVELTLLNAIIEKDSSKKDAKISEALDKLMEMSDKFIDVIEQYAKD